MLVATAAEWWRGAGAVAADVVADGPVEAPGAAAVQAATRPMRPVIPADRMRRASHVRDPPYCPADRPVRPKARVCALSRAIAAGTGIVSVLAPMANERGAVYG